MSFGVSSSAPHPFMLPQNFIRTALVTDAENGQELGTMLSIASREWNEGNYPTEPGEHARIPILSRALQLDNGYGLQIPADLTVGLWVSQHVYFGQFPITRLSEFHDRIGDGIITNAFEFGLLSLEEVHSWKRLEDASEAPVKPVITLTALYGWSEQ